MSQLRTRILALAVLTFFFVGMMPTTAQIVPVGSDGSDGVEEVIQAEQGQTAAPYGTWERAQETVRYYFNTTDVGETDPWGAGDMDAESFTWDLQRPTHPLDEACIDDGDSNTIATIAGYGVRCYDGPEDPKNHRFTAHASRDFNIADPNIPLGVALPDTKAPKLGMTINQIDVTLYAQCDAGSTTPGASAGGFTVPGQSQGLNVAVHVEVKGTNGWERRDHNGGSGGVPPLTNVVLAAGKTGPVARSDGVLEYTGTVELGGDPRFDPARNFGHAGTERFHLEILPQVPGADCIIHLGTDNHPSSISIRADSARYNTWIEGKEAFGNTKEGDFVLGLPDPSTTPSNERRFSAQIIHASLWPGLNQESICGADENENCQHRYGFLGQGASIRFREMATNKLWLGSGAGDVQLHAQPHLNVIGDGVNRIQYDFTYPGSDAQGQPRLPTGQYRFEVIQNPGFGFAASPPITVGLKGIQLTPMGADTHLINPNETTEFRFKITNIGADDDTVSIQVSQPGSLWKASVEPRMHLVRANGGESLFTVTLTPPVGTTVPDAPANSKTVTVTAFSKFVQEVDPVTQTATAEIVEPVTRKVDVRSDTTKVSIQPGQEIRLPGIQVTNEGTAQDSFTLQASVPAGNPGWLFSTVPDGVTALAGSTEDVELRIKAPTAIADGTTIPLSLKATRVGQSSVNDTQVIDLVIDLVVDLVLGQDYEEAAALRKMAPPHCQGERVPTSSVYGDFLPATTDVPEAGPVPGRTVGNPFWCSGTETLDRDAASSALFTLTMTNPSTKEDTFTLRSDWPGGGGRGGNDCESGSANPQPEFWRFDLADAANSSATPELKSLSTEVTIPGQTTLVKYVRIGHLPITDPYNSIVQGRNCSQVTANGIGNNPELRFTMRSLNDTSVERSISFKVVTIGPDSAPVGANQYEDTVNDVDIHLPVGVENKVQGVEEGNETRFRFHVRNTGNERDSVFVSVPAPSGPSAAGWTHRLEFNSSIPSTLTCEAVENSNERLWLCKEEDPSTGMGVRDLAVFDLVMSASDDLTIGDINSADVRVSSVADGSKIDSLTFRAKIVGQHLFTATSLVGAKSVSQGQSALLPFVIRNIGTEHDRYTVNIMGGDSAYAPRLSETSVSVPPGNEHFGAMSVKVPATAPVGSRATFVMQFTSQSDPAKQAIVGFTTTVVSASALQVVADPTSTITIGQRATDVPFKVIAKADQNNAEGRNVTFTRGSVPIGWSVTPTSDIDQVNFTDLDGDGVYTAVAEFKVKAPADALASSRLPVTITATRAGTGQLSSSTDVVFQVADTFGLTAERADDETGSIVPGGKLVYQVRVTNTGLSDDSVTVSVPTRPAGWSVSVDPAQDALGPLESKVFNVEVTAPAGATPGDTAALVVVAQSESDDLLKAEVLIGVRVGTHSLELSGIPAEPLRAAPGETKTFVLTVNNTGDLVDRVQASASVDGTAYDQFVEVVVSPAEVDILPNSTKAVSVHLRFLPGIPSDVLVTTSFLVESVFDNADVPAGGSADLLVQTYRFQAADVDGDGIDEYAVDKDLDPGNGFETFVDVDEGSGRSSRLADLPRFLSDSARQAMTVQVTQPDGTLTTTLRYIIDPDADGRHDLLLDDSGDGLPDLYWDPDRNHTHRIAFINDINADSVGDYFVQAKGPGAYSHVFDVVTGKFTPLVAVDLGDPGTACGAGSTGATELDYIVDKNGNGLLDADETVLYTGAGVLVTVLKVDVDGDGRLDDVFDVDGDGRVDCFVRNGETVGRAITLRDVNGDGWLDWVYDSNLDGRPDAYYDPVAQTGGHRIDASERFAHLAARYWYVPALFLLVIVLFAVLVAVTRR